MKAFAREVMLLEHSAFSYRISNKLAIEGDGNGQKDRNKYKEVERERAIMKYFDCKFIKIYHDEKDFDMFVEVGKMFNHINTLINYLKSLSKKLSELRFKSDHLLNQML